MRIDRFLSHMNVGTRKTLKPLLKAGRVRVADKVIKEAKYQFIDKSSERLIYVSDRIISDYEQAKKRYIND